MIGFQNIRELTKSIRNSVYFEPLVHGRIRKIKKFLNFQPPFLITCSGSSGSHLLGILLDSHPNIGVGPELYLLNKRKIYGDYTYFQNNLQNWLSTGLCEDPPGYAKRFFTGVEYYGWDRRLLPFLAKNTNSIKQFLDVFFGYFLINRKKTMWGDKLPGNVKCIKEFLETFPKGKIIHLVRDGRDVVTSLFRRKIPIINATEIWLHSNALALEWKTDDRLILVKYEDLVADPNTTMERIQKHLGVQVEDLDKLRDSNFFWQKIISSENENIHGQWNLNPLFSPISTSAIGVYKQNLAEKDLAIFYNYSSSQSNCVFPENSIQSVNVMLTFFGYK
jgi:hypothetical protein